MLAYEPRIAHPARRIVLAARSWLRARCCTSTRRTAQTAHAFSTTVVFPTRCVLCLPLIAHEAVIGLLYLGRNLPFGPSDISLASATADIIASAFDRVQLFEKTRQQLERLTALRAIDQSILAAPDLELTLTILLENITGLLKVDAVEILLYDPRHQVLLVAAEQGMPRPAHPPQESSL